MNKIVAIRCNREVDGRQRCRQDIYPLDQLLGLASGVRVTMGLRERSLWATVEVSYGKAHEFLRKFTGLEVIRKKIHQMALEEGRRIEGWEEERRRVVFEQAKEVEGTRKVPEVLYIQVDGTGVNDRASRQWMECKVGLSFSERVKVSKDRVWLVDKKSYASIEGAEAFGEKFFLDCVKQGVLEAKRVIFIGDGAGWIRRLKEAYFPQAIGVLDVWHLERELKRALGEEKKDVVEALKVLALEGKVREILQRLLVEGSRARGVEEG